MINLDLLGLSEIIEGGNVIVSLSERSLGRVVASDVKNPINGENIIKKNEMIDEAACEKIDAAGVKLLMFIQLLHVVLKKEFVQNVMEETYLEVKWFMLVKL